METDDDGDSATYREIYGVQLLDDIHNYLPAILYNHQRFRTIGDLLGYVRSRAEELNGYQFHETQAEWVRRRRVRQERLIRQRRERQNAVEEEGEREEDEVKEDESAEESQTNPFLENIFQPQSLLTPFLLPRQRSIPPTIVETLLQFAAPELTSTRVHSRWPTSPYGFSTAASTTTQGLPPNFFDPVPIFPTAEQLEAASMCLTADISATEQVCSICQENYRVGDQQRFLLYCAHFFHVRCVDRWFESNVRCPLCRHDIREGGPSPTSDVSGNTGAIENHEYETIIHTENGVVEAFTILRSTHQTNDFSMNDTEDNSYSESDGDEL